MSLLSSPHRIMQVNAAYTKSLKDFLTDFGPYLIVPCTGHTGAVGCCLSDGLDRRVGYHYGYRKLDLSDPADLVTAGEMWRKAVRWALANDRRMPLSVLKEAELQ